MSTNLLSKITFLKSAPNLGMSPLDLGQEVAFVGRSNAGKSSAFNAIVNQKLARTSKTPGRTQLINYFSLSETQRFVDLPGYGYARVPKAIQIQITHLLNEYLHQRRCLTGVVLVMDIRHPLSPLDQGLIDILVQREIAIHILLTKSDKLNRGPANAAVLAVRQRLGPAISVQAFSALKREGLLQAQQQVLNWLASV